MTPNKKNRNLSLAPWNILLVFTILVAGTSYVLQMSSVTSRGYQMRDLEVEVSDLELEAEQLSVKVAETTRLQNVTERMQILGFESSSGVVHITDEHSVDVR